MTPRKKLIAKIEARGWENEPGTVVWGKPIAQTMTIGNDLFRFGIGKFYPIEVALSLSDIEFNKIFGEPK